MNVETKILKAKDKPDLGSIDWVDPFRLNDQLAEDERMIRDSAKAYASEKLAPRVVEADDEETTDPEIFRDMGEMGLLGVTLPEQYGGLGTYISNQRLLRATYDLSQVEPARGLIRRTAERWGCSSGGQFNRTIRNTFGTSPGELFEAPLEQLNTLPDFDYLNSFLNRQPTALEENA